MISSKIAFRVASVLWILWGAVHVLAGVMTMFLPTSEAIAGIADAAGPAALEQAYSAATGAIVRQHGWNLAWGGLLVLVAGAFVWRGDRRATYAAAVVGGMLDLGYFIFLDLGGHVHFVPGTVMTFVSGSAIVLSLVADSVSRQSSRTKQAL